jgi:predicted phosphodiesterase
MHVPPITFFEESKKDCHDMSCEKEVQKEVLALFREYDVDLVISGHEHTFDYKKESDINYVLSGNSGNEDRYEGALDGDFFTFFKIKGDEIELQAFTKEGKIAKEAQIK